MDPSRDADAPRIGQAFEPGRDVDAVAKDVAILDDDVAHIDADTQIDALVCWQRALRSATAAWILAAQCKASTTLANSTKRPSPVVLTMRP